MAGIFISYRRDDASGHAGRLYDALVGRFGRDLIFMDINTLRPGLDFVDALEQAVATADVLLAVIGPRWATATSDGSRRLDNPDDFVRREVAAGLARDDIVVVPVLVGGAKMPEAAALPKPLRPLRRRQLFAVRDERWNDDVGRLVEALEPLVKPPVVPQGSSLPLHRRNFVVGALGLLGAVLVALVAWARSTSFRLPDDGQGTPTPAHPVDKLAFGNVPTPSFEARPIQLSLEGEDRPIFKPEGQGQDNLGRREVQGIVLHRMYGTLRAADEFLRDPATTALADYGVGTADTDGPEDDGIIFRWNDPEGSQSGWANGPFQDPSADGKAFVDRFGIDAINRALASIEISGRDDQAPISEKAIKAVAGLCAYWADRVHIPWDTYPLNPATGLPFVYWHSDFDGTKTCPGQVVKDATTEIEGLTKTFLKTYQS